MAATGMVDKAIEERGLASECSKSEVDDMRSRSVLFNSQDSKQIFFVYSKLPAISL